MGRYMGDGHIPGWYHIWNINLTGTRVNFLIGKVISKKIITNTCDFFILLKKLKSIWIKIRFKYSSDNLHLYKVFCHDLQMDSLLPGFRKRKRKRKFAISINWWECTLLDLIQNIWDQFGINWQWIAAGAAGNYTDTKQTPK